MRIFAPNDGRLLDIIRHLDSWSEPQTLYAVLSPVTKHLSVVSFFMMCAVGLGICVWTVQAWGFNCSLPLKLIQNHLDPLSAGTAEDLSPSLSHPPSLPLSSSFCLCLSLALSLSTSLAVCLSHRLTHSPLLLCCQVYLSFQLPWTILFLCHSVVRVMCMWVWGCWGGICYLEGISTFNLTLTSMFACWAST